MRKFFQGISDTFRRLFMAIYELFRISLKGTAEYSTIFCGEEVGYMYVRIDQMKYPNPLFLDLQQQDSTLVIPL